MRYVQRVNETLQKDRRWKWRLSRLASGITHLNNTEAHELGCKKCKDVLHAIEAYERSRSIAVLILNLVARRA